MLIYFNHNIKYKPLQSTMNFEKNKAVAVVTNPGFDDEFMVDVVSKFISCPYVHCSVQIPFCVSVFPGIAPDDEVPEQLVEKLEGKTEEVFMTEQGPSYRTKCEKCGRIILVVFRMSQVLDKKYVEFVGEADKFLQQQEEEQLEELKKKATK